MGIYDVGYGGFGAFRNDIRIDNIPKVNEVKPVEEVKPVAEESKQSIEIREVDNRPRSVDPGQTNLEFNRGNDYSYIGKNKDIANLDVAKAISDMQQDSVLQEYNYFVGSNGKVFSSEDGTVIAK